MKVLFLMSKVIIVSFIFLSFGCGENKILSFKTKTATSNEDNSNALQFAELRTGLSFSANSVMIYESDGGGREPSWGFYTWSVFTPGEIYLPPEKTPSGEYGYSDEPWFRISIFNYVKTRFDGYKLSEPMYCFASSWKTNGYIFTGDAVRTREGDFLVIQQFRDK